MYVVYQALSYECIVSVLRSSLLEKLVYVVYEALSYECIVSALRSPSVRDKSHQREVTRTE